MSMMPLGILACGELFLFLLWGVGLRKLRRFCLFLLLALLIGVCFMELNYL